MKAVQDKTQPVVSKRLMGKVALVTGGSRGIGAGIAMRLAAEGACVAIGYAKSKSQATDLVGKLSQLEVKAAAFQADASSGEQSQKLVDDVIKEFGKIDILINNAGVLEAQPLEGMSIEHYQKIFDVNVRGVIATTIAAVKKLSNGGRIINVSSIASKASAPGFSVYSATKSAVDTLTRCWSQELGPRKITVNAVAPGATSSDMYDSNSEDLKQLMITKTALGRVGQPDDIAAVVAFLASDDGRWVTGQTIYADGGLIF